MRSERLIGLAAMAAACGVIATGCGSSSPPSPGGGQTKTPTESAFAWTRCMRSHGAGVPDPHVSVSNGATSISQVMPASAAAAPAFKGALKACASLQAAPQNNRRGRQTPNKQALLAFARCLRAHNLSGFPDPTPQGQLTSEMLRAAGIDVRGPAFLSAARRCIAVTRGQITMAELAAAANRAH